MCVGDGEDRAAVYDVVDDDSCRSTVMSEKSTQERNRQRRTAVPAAAREDAQRNTGVVAVDPRETLHGVHVAPELGDEGLCEYALELGCVERARALASAREGV